MVRQDNIAPVAGSHHRRKIVGRGDGSGHGSYSGKGIKGQKSRGGNNKMRPGFEGGQLPLIKRLPQKRGFFNVFRVKYAVVNVGELNKFEPGTEVTPEKLLEARLIRNMNLPVKILAQGDITNALTIKVNKISESAKVKIEAAGGKVEEVASAA